MIRHKSAAAIATVIQLVLVGSLVAPVAQRAAAPARVAWLQRPGRDAPAERLAHRAGRSQHPGRRLSAVDGAQPDGRYVIVSNNGWSRPSLTVVDLAQRFVQSPGADRSCVARTGVASRGQQLYSSGAAENTVNEFAWEKGGAECRGTFVIRPPGGPARQASRTSAAPGSSADSRSIGTARGSTQCMCSAAPSVLIDLAAAGPPHGRSAGGAVHSAAFTGRRDPVRLALGRREGARVRSRHARAKGESRSASIPTRWCSRRTARGCSSPARIPTRSGSRPRDADGARADLGRALSQRARRARRPTASRSRPTATRCSVANADNNTVAVVDVKNRRRERRRRDSSRRAGTRRRCCSAGRQASLRAERQGPDRQANPARSAGDQPDGRRAIRRPDAAGRAVDHRSCRTRPR